MLTRFVVRTVHSEVPVHVHGYGRAPSSLHPKRTTRHTKTTKTPVSAGPHLRRPYNKLCLNRFAWCMATKCQEAKYGCGRAPSFSIASPPNLFSSGTTVPRYRVGGSCRVSCFICPCFGLRAAFPAALPTPAPVPPPGDTCDSYVDIDGNTLCPAGFTPVGRGVECVDAVCDDGTCCVAGETLLAREAVVTREGFSLR